MNVINLLENNAKRHGEKPAIIFRDKQISFSQLKDKVFSLSQSLLRLKIKPGDKIAIYLPSWPEYVYSYLAAWAIGA